MAVQAPVPEAAEVGQASHVEVLLQGGRANRHVLLKLQSTTYVHPQRIWSS